jgi:hypothetical protein
MKPSKVAEGVGEVLGIQAVAEYSVLSEKFEVRLREETVPLLNRAVAPHQLAQRFGVGDEQGPEQRPFHDGQEVTGSEAVGPPSAWIHSQSVAQFLDRSEELPLADRTKEV